MEIHRELSHILNFVYATKIYMHKPKWHLQNETHKIQWNFEVQIDLLIPARRPDFAWIIKEKKKTKGKREKRRTCRIVDLAVHVDYKVKIKESEKRHRYLNLASCGIWEWQR